eukprot:8369809-Pyramimonas_sp.AAC.1
MGTEFISFMRPRLMSAGKLSLRGVQADPYPLNMNSVSSFRPFSQRPAGNFTWSGSSRLSPEGWAPIVVVNQGGSLETGSLSLN